MASRTRSFRTGWHLVLLLPLLWAAAVLGAAPERRARTPQWHQVPAGIFFEDAFEQGLTGTPRRPRSTQPAHSPNGAPALPLPLPTRPRPRTPVSWTEAIAAETIEDELKAILGRVDGLLANASDFKGHGYLAARREFALAAMLFAIIQEYPASVRWKAQAAAARMPSGKLRYGRRWGRTPSFSRLNNCSSPCKNWSAAAVSQVRGRSRRPIGAALARAPLMQRLEMAQAERLTSCLASVAAFQKSPRRVVHEAQIVAAIAEALLQEGMEDAVDEDYRDYCRAMQQAAQEIQRAAERGDYETARGAGSRLQQTCTDCHSTYRA